MSELIKVMIVDDHDSIRKSLEKEFTPENGFEVVSSLSSAAYAEGMCERTRPDVVITDVCTEAGASGLEAAESILKRYPHIKVIVTSGFDEITYAPRAKEMGAHAFVYKSRSLEYYHEVTRRVLEGEYVFPESKTIPVPQGEAPFTDREMEILNLLCRHRKPSEIAAELYIAEKTVRWHIQNMLGKAGFTSVTDLIVYIVSKGWINPNF